MMSARLDEHIERYDLTDSAQSAFKKYHSTETSLLKVQTDMLEATDNGNMSILVVLDLSAAFDTVDHHIIVTRLCQTYGITGTGKALIKVDGIIIN